MHTSYKYGWEYARHMPWYEARFLFRTCSFLSRRVLRTMRTLYCKAAGKKHYILDLQTIPPKEFRSLTLNPKSQMTLSTETQSSKS